MMTKYGNANINKGRYCITSGKEGNHGKFLHRLIWEDHYKTKIPKGYFIHHINHNPLDNRIQNLQCVDHIVHNKHHHNILGKQFGKYRGTTYADKISKPWRKVWRSDIVYNKKQTSLGYFNDPISGEIVYNFVFNEIYGDD